MRFHETHGRAPQHGEGRDIFERIYAVRLEQIRKLPEAEALLVGLDTPGLLRGSGLANKRVDELDEDALLAELGVDTPRVTEDDITVLKHVRSAEDKRAAEEVANRSKCEDFEQFKPLFETVKQDLQAGIRQSRTFQSKEKALDDIVQGAYFIIGGQTAYIAEAGDAFTTDYGRRDSRLRVVFDNGTEASVLMRSLQRSLHRDEAARLITDPEAGPLFGSAFEDGDVESGTIYVLRSKSDHPYVANHRELIHKIGVTGGKVETRIANAALEATYLLADVEIVATYKLASINRTKLENLFHRIFAPAQLDLTIQDRFGHPVRPREWFLVPLHAIDEAVKRVADGTITGMIYEPTKAKLVKIK